jgi:hypothetical protein
MFPVKTNGFHLLKYCVILLAAAPLLSCNAAFLFKKPTPTVRPQAPTEAATIQPTFKPQTQPTAAPSPVKEGKNGQVEVLDTIYQEDFSKPPSDWKLIPLNSKDLVVKYSIKNGLYSWSARAVTDSPIINIPDPSIFLPEDDFLISVTTRIQPEAFAAASGIIFRFQDFENFYYAKLDASGGVSAYALQKNKWIKLAGPLKSDHWISGKLNRLDVMDDNSHYELRVNDYPALEFDDSRFLGGKAGLIAELNAGMEETYLFDDFRVMKTGGSAAMSDEPENTIPPGGGRDIAYEGDLNGIKYTIHLPAGFIYSSSGDWDQFCLDEDPNLCVAVRRQNGNWNDPEDMANEVMAAFGQDVTRLKINHQQHTKTTDGFTAYWVDATYTNNGLNYASSRLYVIVQHVGFEVIGFGQPEMMKKYQAVIKAIMESFVFEYN